MRAGGKHRFRVVLTGAFSTGTPVDVQVPEYAEFQHQLGEKLDGHGDGTTWNPKGVRWLEQPSYDEGGGGYSNLVPLVLIQREGTELTDDIACREKAAWRRRAEALEDGDATGVETLGPEREGWEWELKRAFVQLFDLGVGVIVGVYDVRAPWGCSAARAAGRVREWSDLTRTDGKDVEWPIGATYEAAATESVKSFRRAVAECKGRLPRPSLPESLTAPTAGEGDTRERGRLKWLHPVFVLSPGPAALPRRARRRARPYRAVHSQSVGFDGGLFVPGVKRSVMVLAEEQEEEDLFGATTPIGLITLNWAYYALFMDIDRGLLRQLDDDRDDGSASFRELERGAVEAHRSYVRVAEAKARLDSALNGLGPAQVGLWEAIAGVTRFGLLIESVESKLEVMQTIAETRVQQAAADASQRSRRVLTVLSTLTLVTVAIALIGYVVGGQTDKSGHDTLRVAVVVGAAVVAVAAFLLAEREFLRRR